MKPGQNVCLDEICDEFEKGSCGVKKLVASSFGPTVELSELEEQL